MFIKTIVIEGVEGDVTIRRTSDGASVEAHGVAFDVSPRDPREDRYGVAYNAAKVICGTTKRGEPNATRSMIHDVLNEIERVAGC
ncbi:MAG: hypothetical protein LAT64_02555 [Phycisphaerales bacterium]|nr:hypothetical protein [Planctomycetota bacterium]MCH8507639.1 hypothetical protein [Phycisphaerales bacterium]